MAVLAAVTSVADDVVYGKGGSCDDRGSIGSHGSDNKYNSLGSGGSSDIDGLLLMKKVKAIISFQSTFILLKTNQYIGRRKTLSLYHDSILSIFLITFCHM